VKLKSRPSDDKSASSQSAIALRDAVWCRSSLGIVLLISAAALTRAEENVATESHLPPAAEVIDLWPGAPPAWVGTSEPERDTSDKHGPLVAGKSVIRLGHVSKPQLHVYPVDTGGPIGQSKSFASTMVIICPGGGYRILAWDLEGTEIAERFNALGFSAAVVKYRVPTSETDQAWLPPVQDIQRAVSTLRSKANGEEAVYKRVGVIGFSAGGNAAARVACTTGKRFYEPTDEIDQANCNVDFAGLVYPWLMVADATKPRNDRNTPAGIIPDLNINASTPPIFFAHAVDDPISCRNSSELFSVLQSKGVPAELHIFASGGHGFGARDKCLPIANWPKQLASWLATLPTGQ